MEFEVLKKSHVKRNILIGVIAVLIISAIILNFTRAKYRSVATTPLIHSEINYTLPDLNIIGLYVNGEEVQELDSTKNYVLDTSKSIRTYKDGSTIDNLIISYDSNTKGLSITPYTTKGTKCAGRTVQTRSLPFTDTTIVEGTNGKGDIYQTTDWKGTTYYFAGNPSNNWVQFGGYYWRIIRINGDGSIRMIYQGTSANTTGTNTQIQESEFNSSYNRSEYVGLKYTSGEQHGQTTDSPILDILQSWYTSSNLDEYAEYIDASVGFCSDRSMASGYIWSSRPNSPIYYAAYERLSTNKSPSLACTSSDIIVEPVGLITADEVAFAGGVDGPSNQSFYLYNNQYYWTMSPYWHNSSTYVVPVWSDGTLSWSDVNDALDVRPVINLAPNVTITGGNGTVESPFEVVD